MDEEMKKQNEGNAVHTEEFLKPFEAFVKEMNEKTDTKDGKKAFMVLAIDHSDEHSSNVFASLIGSSKLLIWPIMRAMNENDDFRRALSICVDVDKYAESLIFIRQLK